MRNILFSMLFIVSDTSNAEVISMSSNLIHEDAEDGLKLAFESSVKLISVSSTSTSMGSGNLFIYKGEEYIITANHVVADSLFLDIIEKNGNISTGTVYLSFPELDLAIIKPNGNLTGTLAVKFNFAGTSKLGKEVFHCGHPIGIPFNISTGIITGFGATGYVINSISLPGSSGSVVFDKEGKVIGVVVSIAAIGDQPNVQLVEGIVRVVPIDLSYILDRM